MRARESANRIRCASNMRQIGLALHHYHDTFLQFPPGTSYKGVNDPFPFMSWLTRLLPFVEQDALWRQSENAFAIEKDFRRNPPHTGFGTVQPIYQCPSDPRSAATERLGPFEIAFTNYLGNEGVNFQRRDGVLFLNSRSRLTDIIDGTSSTLLAGERPPSADSVLGWWYAGWGQNKDGSAEVVLGVREINSYYPSGTCPTGPYEYGPGKPQNLCDTFHFWSRHAGGGAQGPRI
jgi:hypothetical protein